MCARSFLHDNLVLNVNDTLSDDPTIAICLFALMVPVQPSNYVQPANWTASVLASATHHLHRFIPFTGAVARVIQYLRHDPKCSLWCSMPHYVCQQVYCNFDWQGSSRVLLECCCSATRDISI